MDADFWHERWKSNQIAFHLSEANPLLLTHFKALSLASGSRVFLPLCGKTLDIAWLLCEGFRVVGVELSELAVEQLFTELGVQPSITTQGAFKHYQAQGIDLFVGDIFELSKNRLGPVDAVYDRAALVALPEALRGRYTAHLTQITAHSPQLLICFEYDQTLQDGPPFSITHTEVNQHYSDAYALTLIASTDVPGGLKGTCAAMEHVWLLRDAGAA